jgi:hypothetical protein
MGSLENKDTEKSQIINHQTVLGNAAFDVSTPT